MTTSRLLCAALCVGGLASASQALADTSQAIQVISADAAARSVTGYAHCTQGDRAGRVTTYTVAGGVDFTPFTTANAMQGISVGDDGNTITALIAMPCDPQPQDTSAGTRPFPPRPDGPHRGDTPRHEDNTSGQQGGSPQGPTDEGEARPEDGPAAPTLSPAFLARHWRFATTVITPPSGGTFSVSIDRVLGAPRALRRMSRDLEGMEARIVIYPGTRFVCEQESRCDSHALEADGEVTIAGKLAPVADWRVDEDGTPIPTILAKRVRIVE